jgi:hypothetical protein
VGYKGSIIYRIWNLKVSGINVVSRSRDVTFNKELFYSLKILFPEELVDYILIL